MAGHCGDADSGSWGPHPAPLLGHTGARLNASLSLSALRAAKEGPTERTKETSDQAAGGPQAPARPGHRL